MRANLNSKKSGPAAAMSGHEYFVNPFKLD